MLDGDDKVLGILPFFHSFGFMAGLWLPAVHGIGVVFHPNPLDAKSISELVSKHQVTFLVATPTFLQAYMKRCSPEHFGSLQKLLAATVDDLQAVEGVGEARARSVREGLSRLAEASILERYV